MTNLIVEGDLGQKLTEALEKVKEGFGANIRIERTGISLNDIRIQFAANADEPTTASAAAGLLDLPSVLSQVDPEGISSIFPDAMNQLMAISSFMNATTQSSRNDIIYDSLTNAIRILIDRYSYDLVIAEINKALENNGIDRVTEKYREIVRNSLSQIVKDLAKYGPDNIPVPEYEIITEADLEPVPPNLVTVVPNFYIQRYRKYANDTYKGYEEWYSKETGETVYLKREIGSYYFESMQEEIYGSSETKLADSLAEYIEDEELVLTVNKLNQLIEEQEISIKETSMEKAAGKGSSGDIFGLLQKALPHISASIDTQKIDQLANSVLDKSGISEVLDDFTENMAMLGTLNGMIDDALKLPTAFEELANLNLSNLTSALNLGDIASNLNINLDGINLNIGSELNNAVNQIQNAASQLEPNIQRATQALGQASALLDNIRIRV